MPSEFPTIWESRLRRISVAKLPIELLNDSVQPVNPAPYRTGSKTREFLKFEIVKILK